jgi:succinoglycan biosynthesis transport protein ExoP
MAEPVSSSSAATLRSLIRVVRRRLWLIGICVVLVPTSVVAYSLAQPEEYTATASLLFRDPGFTALFEATPVLAPDGQDDWTATTNIDLAALDVVAAGTARRLGVAPSDVTGNVDVAAEPSSSVAEVTATDTSPPFAARLANAYAQEFIAQRRASDVAKIAKLRSTLQSRLRSVERRLAVLQDRRAPTGPSRRSQRAAERRALTQERDTLLERQGRLHSLASAVTGPAELVQRATPPSSPSSPKPRRNAVIGLGLGLVLGIALALIFEMLDRRLRDPEEVPELVDIPILGAIPHSRVLAEPPGPGGLQAAESHAFHMLRASLRYYNEGRELGSVLITSAGPRDGKTTVAWNLAAVSAGAGQSVMLLEADLRRPSLAGRFRVPADRGLSDVLRGEARLGAVINEVVVGRGLDGSTEPVTMDLVVAGTVRSDITALIESDRMDGLIREAQEHYDLVVIDTPPMSVVPDAMPLMTKVSGVIVVTRLGRTTRDAVSFLGSQLTRIRAPVLGAVVNSITRQDVYYGAGYEFATEYRSHSAVT